MPRFNQDHDRELIFVFQVKGPVSEDTITKTLLVRLGKIKEGYGLVELQNKGLVGKLRVQIPKTKVTPGVSHYNLKQNFTRGYLRFSTGMPLTKKSVLCTLIEQVRRVSSFEAKFKFLRQVNLLKENYPERLSRSIEIAYQIKKTESTDQDWEKALDDVLGKKQIVTYGRYCFGSEFTKLKNVFVVEGKNDLLKLLDVGFSNVMSLGGYSFDDQEVMSYLKGKSVIVFCDGDQGGINNVRKLSSICKIDYIIPLMKHEKVQNLENSYILKLISNRVLFDPSMLQKDSLKSKILEVTASDTTSENLESLSTEDEEELELETHTTPEITND